MTICNVDGCNGKKIAKGMCKLHYQRFWRNGSPYVSRPCLHLPVDKKFWLYVKKNSKEKCWDWTGFRDKDGYGKLRAGKTNIAAHRISFMIHYGKFNKKSFVLHRCNNPSCVNPNHLYLGNQFDNMRDRKKAGNEPSGENHPNAKITDKEVYLIRQSKGTYKQIAKDFGISASQVGNIKRGDQRK